MSLKPEEGKYIVIKVKDVESILGPRQQAELGAIIDELYDVRKQQGKNPQNEYWVVNIDEPYAEIVGKTVLEGESAKVRRSPM